MYIYCAFQYISLQILFTIALRILEIKNFQDEKKWLIGSRERRCGKDNITKKDEIIDTVTTTTKLHFLCNIELEFSIWNTRSHIFIFGNCSSLFLDIFCCPVCSSLPYDVKGRRHFLFILKGIVVLHIQQCQLILIRIYTWPTQNSNKENGQICVLILLFLLNLNVFFASNVTLVTFEKQ